MFATMKNIQQPFWLLTISVMIALIVPKLIMDGMFIDGILYTAVSHNLANGLGSFWFPWFSEQGVRSLDAFHEQPPLAFGIQSVFFRVLGDSIYVERFYSFLTACIQAWLLAKFWKLLSKDHPKLAALSWFPVLLWIIIPVTYWEFQNNMLENTMGIFTLAAGYCHVKGIKATSKAWSWWVLSGIFIFLATMSKGFPGFFPIVIPAWWWLVMRDKPFPRMLLQALVGGLTPLVIYALFMLDPMIYKSLTTYLTERVGNSINNVKEVDNRFWIVGRLFMELIPVIGVSIILLAIGHFTKARMNETKPEWKMILFLVLTGICGSFPIMVTLEQAAVYFAPSLHYFALAFAFLTGPVLVVWLDKVDVQSKGLRIFRWVTMVLLCGVLVVSGMQVGKRGRDHELLHDVYEIGSIVPEGAIIGLPKPMWKEWSLQCYLMRHFYISLDATGQKRTYYLTNKKLALPSSDSTYRQMPIKLQQHILYELVE